MENINIAFSKADGVLFPVSKEKDKVMIVFTGSDGGLDHAIKCAKYLQDNGIDALALGYFKTEHSAKKLDRISI